MSINKLSSYSRYWSSSFLYRNNPVRNAMSRNRFKAILCFLQINPPADIDKSKYTQSVTL